MVYNCGQKEDDFESYFCIWVFVCRIEMAFG
jgi:hypothetical protein